MKKSNNAATATAAAAAATEAYGFSTHQLIPAKSELFPSPLPFRLRLAAWLLAVLCSSAFYIGPTLLLLPFILYSFYPKVAATLFCINIVLVTHPVAPWHGFRKWFQLFYHLFDFHHNLTPKVRDIAIRENHLGIVAMHPHAIIPLHAFLYAGFCDEFIPELYGMGTTTDGALLLPVLRHILQFLSVGSAHKQSILYAMQNLDKNLFILPGGVAEIFLSHRRRNSSGSGGGSSSGSCDKQQHQQRHVQIIKARRYGLMKLALETGAILYPVYVFGATDIFDQLTPIVEAKKNGGNDTTINAANILESISRRIKGGLTLYWGKYFLPIPHTPRLTMVMGDPIYPVVVKVQDVQPPPLQPQNHDNDDILTNKKRTCPRIENPTPEQVEELMSRYVNALERLFEQYKVQAGYRNDVLEIL